MVLHGVAWRTSPSAPHAEAGRSPLTQGPVSLLRCQQDPSTLWVMSMPCPKIFCLVSEHLAFFLVLHLEFLHIKDNCLYLCLTWILQTYSLHSLYKPNPNKPKRVQKNKFVPVPSLPFRNVWKHLNTRPGYYQKHSPVLSAMPIGLWITNAFPLKRSCEQSHRFLKCMGENVPNPR